MIAFDQAAQLDLKHYEEDIKAKEKLESTIDSGADAAKNAAAGAGAGAAGVDADVISGESALSTGVH